jgi:hypothetical protein
VKQLAAQLGFEVLNTLTESGRRQCDCARGGAEIE